MAGRFLGKYALRLAVGFILLALLTVLLVILTSEPQKGGFVYQIF